MGSIIGGIIFFVGIILLIANVSGWWPALLYSGFITIIIGTLILNVSEDDKVLNTSIKYKTRKAKNGIKE